MKVHLTSGVVEMAKVRRLFWLMVFLPVLGLIPAKLQAQCSCAATDYASINVAGWTVGQTGTITTCQFGGERSTIFNTVAGAVYRISTCGAAYDTQLSIYTTGCTFVAYNDDNGPACGGVAASVQFASPGGNLYSVMNQYYCSTNTTCTNVTITLVSLPGPTCNYVVPATGNNSITASSGNICDHAGTGNYSNSVDGYTVIYPPSACQSIRLTFSQFVTEGSFDFVTIYDGVGTGGPILFGPTSGSPALPTVTSISGPITIRFNSDGSVVYAGFSAAISVVAAPASTLGSVSNPGPINFCDPGEILSHRDGIRANGNRYLGLGQQQRCLEQQLAHRHKFRDMLFSQKDLQQRWQCGPHPVPREQCRLCGRDVGHHFDREPME
ncbi:MAG: CUB domain-containing protein [Bacteroidetes bacterium]|nr:CUB domain-containing protein [Bacteroidota bacterium]